MVVYRVQNKQGEGPYTMLGTQPKDINFMHRTHDNKERKTHPTPIEDIGIQREVKEKIEYCGFVNIV